MKVAISICGETPLIIHADDVLQADEVNGWRRDPANKNLSVPGDDRSPAWTWMSYLYSDGTHMTIPSHNVMVALRHAGAKVVMKGRKTFKDITQSGIIMMSEYLDLFVAGKQVKMSDIEPLRDKPFTAHLAGVKPLGFKLFVKRAGMPNGTKHIRVRPRIEDWMLTGTLTVTAPEITFDVLEQLFEIAGRGGICEWRAAGVKSPGPFGLFTTKLKKIS